jgi:ABC-type phosphonate transport system ATPase subunit
MLAANGLYKFYGSVPAVADVTFTLAPGQVLGYLDPKRIPMPNAW